MNIAATALESLKDILPSFEKTTAKIRDAVHALNEKISELQAERQRLVSLPVSAKDVEALLHSQIDKEADNYRKFAVAGLVESLVGQTKDWKPKAKHTAVEISRRMVEGKPSHYGSMFGGIRDASPAHSDRPFDSGRERLTQGAATFFFRAEMKRGASEIVAAMDYPFAAAISMEQVQADITRVESELKELCGARDELVSQAKAHGIVILEKSENDLQTDDHAKASFDSAGWVSGEVSGDEGEEFILYHYRWPNQSDALAALDGENVICRDSTTGQVFSRPWERIPSYSKQALGAPKGLGHLPKFANIPRR